MNVDQLFLALVTTATMGTLGIREFTLQRFSLGVWLVAIPACFWLSKAFGTP